jgi:hypothetical protein
MPAVPASARIPAQRRSGRQAATAPVPQTPSSLVKVPETSRGRCVACGSNRLTEISMTLTDGTPVRFASCRRCEHRAWTDAGEPLPVESVLRKAQKHKDAAATRR